MKLIAKNVLRINQPTREVVEYVRQHYEMPNPDFTRKANMGFWTGNIPKKLYLYETDGNDIILPRGCYKTMAKFFNPEDISIECNVLPHVDYGDIEDMHLYDYQKDAVDDCLWDNEGILQAPAGSGKTQMGIAIIREMQLPALWITHTQDLLNQSYERAARFIDKSLLGTITAGKVSIGTGITFATVQTLSRLDLSQYKDRWGVIIVDECHRACGTPTQMSMFSKVLNSLNSQKRYGLSATVHRSDGMIAATYALLGPISHKVPEEAVAERVMTVTVRPVMMDTPESDEYTDTDGMIIYSALTTYLTDQMDRNQTIIDMIDDKPTLVLSDRVGHLYMLQDMLPPEQRALSAVIDGKMQSKTKRAEREQIISKMRRGELKYLFATYQLAKEGLDIPRLERLHLATPQHDYAVITQSLGRIARTHPGKGEPVVYDYVDRRILYEWRQYKKRRTTYAKLHCAIYDGTRHIDT